METFNTNKTKIGLPQRPFMVRLNKLFGCIAIGNIDLDQPTTLTKNGRGKFLEFALVAARAGYFGTIGKASGKEWTIISALTSKTDDKRLPPGVLVHFPLYGFEAAEFDNIAATYDMQETMGVTPESVIFRLEFSKSIKTQHGSTIKPPDVLTKLPGNEPEHDYLLAAKTILTDYAHYLPDPEQLFPAVFDEKTGHLVSGLIDSSKVTETLALAAN